MIASASVVDALVRAVGKAQVSSGPAIEPRHLGDWMVSMTSGAPLAVVKPRTTADVSAVMRVCFDSGTPVVPQGGLTGLAGGATPVAGAVVLSLERMSGVEDIDPAAATLTALAGTPLQAVQEAAAAAGFLFPLDLGARGSAQIGGNVATNAGGNRVIRYGMTRDLVLGLEAVLADGTVLTSLNKLIKNNAGIDTRQLFVGSEGILGIVTRVVLRLYPQPRTQCVALCALAGYDQVVAFLRHARESLGGTLSAFEMMWPDFYALVTQPGSGIPEPLPPGAGAYVLVEALGAHPSTDAAAFEHMLTTAFEGGVITDSVVAQSAAEIKSDGPGSSDALPAASVDRYYFAQCVKDETMAESIAQAHAAGRLVGKRPLVISVNGAFHTDRRGALIDGVSRRMAGARVLVATIQPVPDPGTTTPDRNDRQRADYVIYTSGERTADLSDAAVPAGAHTR